MRKVLYLFITLNLLLVSAIGGLYYLAETYPFHPGDPLYAVQDLAEQSRLSLSEKGEKGVHMALSLAERRLTNLAHAQNPDRIQAAAIAFDRALSTVLDYSDSLSQDQQELVLAEFNSLLRQAELVVFSIDKSCCETINILHGRITTLLEGHDPDDDPPDSVQTFAAAPAEISAMTISFLGQQVDHSIYPLDGAHKQADCLTCHPDGQYVGTPSECSDCHAFQPVIEVQGGIFPVSFSQENEADPNLNYPHHFEGPCQDCHDADDWIPTSFDHVGVIECFSCHQDASSDANKSLLSHSLYPDPLCMDCHQDTSEWLETAFDHAVVEGDGCISCHSPETPDRHYMGECQKCHVDSSDWGNYVFFHIGYEDCQECHSSPANHYGDSCTTCHYSTRGWSFAEFDHTGFKDCKSCHKAETPRDHYSGQCSRCHNTKAWNKASFYHEGFSVYDCVNCHLKDAPADHYCEDCCRCHNTDNWSRVNVNHTTLTDCADCHSSETPADHYDGLCSNCHNTSNWGQVSFDHTGYSDCADCHLSDAPNNHYGEQCSRCHNTHHWHEVSFDHTGFPDCVACHSTDAPADHYAGQCSKCHDTKNWQNVSFNHSGVTNCTGCHSSDVPDGHWPGQCSNCHTSTKDWSKVKFDHQSSYKDCRACHSDDLPDPDQFPDHPERGQCSRCHSTNTWVVVPTATPDASYLLGLLDPDGLIPIDTPEAVLMVTPLVQSTPDPNRVDIPEEEPEVQAPEPTETPQPEPTDAPDPSITPVIRETETP